MVKMVTGRGAAGMRATIKLARPIESIELDLDQNSLEAAGYIKYSTPITNADKIRYMTDEELAEFLDEVDPVYWTYDTWLKWLKEKVPQA